MSSVKRTDDRDAWKRRALAAEARQIVKCGACARGCREVVDGNRVYYEECATCAGRGYVLA